MGAKSADRREKTIILIDGSKHKIIGSNAKYWLCEGTQFRKNNPDIKEVVEDKPKEKAAKKEVDAK